MVLVMATSSGCSSFDSWSRNEKGAAIGGVAGAGLGAIIGSMTGSWAWGALIGAAGGALAGYVIANETSTSETASSTSAAPAKSAGPQQEEADRQFRLALQAKDSSTSEYHLKKSIEAYPTPYAHNNLGIMYLAKDDRAAAREQFQRALAVDPGYAPAKDNLDKMDGKR
jgi:tetratricopeptide (TPR) repeat protein